MTPAGVALAVIAKAPAPGRSKTRLCPPCTPDEAAQLAAAALEDTLDTVGAVPAPRRVLALDGSPRAWQRRGFELHAQRGDGLGERLGHALGLCGGPSLVVGMDTPQLTRALLGHAARELARPKVDAVLGPAPDGGYWAIGLREPDPAVFAGVPMSSGDTCRIQRERLASLGLRVVILPALRDVDTMADAAAVARLRPNGRFGRAYRALSAAHAAERQQSVAVAAVGAGLERPDG